ncbi:hemerythrin domain-containing protein [Reinekea sp.]|jgi:hemerythrin-like domain-containing protein|uniref:hemerythrin domain-containing protein n=1 Tax=Reinekea sp. TaxID=1970455 RepID=UPI002A7F8A1B|nr:hemerythrin domain-containing protein [Reinekea sp.]
MSTAILQKLNADHKSIAKVLYCLRAQIKGYDDPEIEPNIGQIMDILDYICTVPERWHHPVEDIVFTRLLEKNPPHPEQIRAILAEHAELERLTQELKTAFERVAMDIAVPVSLLYRTATVYLSRQMLHLDAEESVLFPMAEEYLDDNDWSDVEEAAQVVLESLDENAEREYDNLRDTIVNFTDAY